MKTKSAKAYLLFLLLPIVALAQQEERPANERRITNGTFHNTVPEHLYDIILSRPTRSSVTISVLCNEELEGYVEYGKTMGSWGAKTRACHFEKGKPLPIELSPLEAATRYYYRFVYTTPGNKIIQHAPAGYFQTQRKPGEVFSFVIQADSHLDENSSPEVYRETLSNMASDSADFLVDLGDTWMTDKYRPDYKASLNQYIVQRYYFGSVCHSMPLFLTLGNHDGEAGKPAGGNETTGITEWATNTRLQYYYNPVPNAFYSGNEKGLGNYYAWEWGSALFIVLDPFRYTTGNKDPWQRTLGKEQYEWLRATLQKSKASLRFVFIHNLVGGFDRKGKARGGAEASGFYEWGGLNEDSTYGFTTNRPGWEMPIREVLKQSKVNVVFHGHDHLFVKQDADSMVYQLLPQPGATRYGNINSAAEYGYREGVIKNAPGYLKVSVNEKTATIAFIQTSIDGKNRNKEILYSYTVKAK